MVGRILGLSGRRFLTWVCVMSLTVNVFLIFSLKANNRERLTVDKRQHPPVFQDVILSRLEANLKKAVDISNKDEEDKMSSTPKTVLESTDNGRTWNSSLCVQCPEEPPNLLGALADLSHDITPTALEVLFPDMETGGRHRPSNCVARQRLAIVIPYRNRFRHLHILLHNLIPFLIRQEADFAVFVIEQALPGTFNRGALLNIGFLEAQKLASFDCYIFHDTDLVPLNDRHMYRCGDNPRHFASFMSKFKLGTPYKDYFGGVVGFSKRQFLNINGCSNVYFGWGGEDDDLRERTVKGGYTIVRDPVEIVKYNMIKHSRDPGNEANPIRKKLLKTTAKRQYIEGLNSVKYQVNNITLNHLYTWITVTLNKTEILLSAPSYVSNLVTVKQNNTTYLRTR